MILYSEALECISKHASANTTAFTSMAVKIEDALGMACVKTIVSPETVPPFNNSAMDGFAVIASTLGSASESNPITLNVKGSTAAGDVEDTGQGEAWEIMTGAPVPQGYDAVIKVEDTEVVASDKNGCSQKISVKVSAKLKQNIRDAGEDFQIGDAVIKAGDIITAEKIMALASLGIATILVSQKPSVAVLSTGKELVDDISLPLKSGQIRNSNAPYILSALKESKVPVKYAGTIQDESEIFEDKINKLLEGDTNIIISTGAVSMGRYDFVPDSLRKLGAEIIFHKVAIRPGKPVLFAKFPNNIFFFGLPGNPISAAVGLRFFVYPLIRQIQNLSPELLPNAVLTSTQKKKSGFKFFRKAYAYCDESGQLKVDILEGQESFKIHSLLQANCWAILTEKEEITAGEVIKIAPINHNNFIIGG